MTPYKVVDGKLTGDYGIVGGMNADGKSCWVYQCSGFRIEGCNSFDTPEDALADALEHATAIFEKEGDQVELKDIKEDVMEVPLTKWQELARKHLS